jgi:hypothetical protein
MAVSIEAEDLKKSLEIHLSIWWLSLHYMQYLSCLFFKAECFDSGWEFLSRYVTTFIVIKYVEAFLQSDYVIGREVFRDMDGRIKGGRLLRDGGDLYKTEITDLRGDLTDI